MAFQFRRDQIGYLVLVLRVESESSLHGHVVRSTLCRTVFSVIVHHDGQAWKWVGFGTGNRCRSQIMVPGTRAGTSRRYQESDLQPGTRAGTRAGTRNHYQEPRSPSGPPSLPTTTSKVPTFSRTCESINLFSISRLFYPTSNAIGLVFQQLKDSRPISDKHGLGFVNKEYNLTI